MTYCANQWITDQTFGDIWTEIEDRPTLQQALQDGDFLFLTGQMNLTRSTGQIDSLFTLTTTISTVSPVSSAIILRLEDSSRSTLAEYPLNYEGDSEHEEGEDEMAFFDAIVPFPSGVTTISFLFQNSVVMSRTVSANPPAVTLTYPNGGDVITDTVTVDWQASDTDGDALNYSVLYSADGGSTWKTLVAQWSETNYTVDTTRLPGSSTGRFRVIAGDGVNTGQDDSDGDVRVTYRPPVAAIEWPMNEATYVISQTIILSGDASDPDLQPISESGFAWTSDLDGSLGNGREILLTSLSLGTHTITLTVTDSGGQVGKDSIQLIVVETWSPPRPLWKIYLPLVVR